MVKRRRIKVVQRWYILPYTAFDTKTGRECRASVRGKCMAEKLSWCEISTTALARNLLGFRSVTGARVILAPVVKANGYGHGLELASRAFVAAGADALCVNDIYEAFRIRRAGITAPVHVTGRVLPDEAAEAVELDVSAVVYDIDLVEALERAAASAKIRFRAHLKLETGTNRQGVSLADATSIVRRLDSCSSVFAAGASMHFADVEDTTDDEFAHQQLEQFNEMIINLGLADRPGFVRSVANSAATILWPRAHFEMVRPGISVYGMWPSSETMVTAALTSQNQIDLRPALTWKTRVAQVRQVPENDYVGYGRTFRTTTPMTVAIIPVGYYDGFDRGLSNGAYVLVGGRRAQVRGRICMNMAMIDVTGLPDVHPGSEVVLIGRDGDEFISAETFASWCGTINYEVTCRISEAIPRVEIQE